MVVNIVLILLIQVWVEKKPVKRLQLALSLPRVCPSHLVSERVLDVFITQLDEFVK